MKRVLICGGSGLVGRHLTNLLLAKGFEVLYLSRTKVEDKRIRSFLWNWEKDFIDPVAIESADAIVHLAGAGIFDNRWTKERKQLIQDSRIKSTELLLREMRRLGTTMKAFVSASAVGFYGAITSEHVFIESDPPAIDFLGSTCAAWESAVQDFQQTGVRVVMLRTGVVLAPDAKFMKSLLTTARLGLAAALGSGRQYMPWIHVDDLCAMYLRALEDTNLSGAYNAVAPQHLTNRQFTKELTRAVKRPFWLPALPVFLLRGVLGERAVLLTEGSRVSSEKISSTGFVFSQPEIQEAFRAILRVEWGLR